MKTRLLVSPLIVAALVAAGCGSSGSSGSAGSGADPAKLAPATAPLYVEAAIRPDGQLGADAKAALGKLLRTSDPGGKLIGLVDKALGKDGLSWNADIKPWLGQRIGVFVSSFGARQPVTSGGSAPAASKPVAAIIADTTDTGKAKDALAKLVGHPGADGSKPSLSTRDYKGVSLTYNATRDSAAGIVDGYAVGGSLTAVQQVIDTAKGGRPLTDVADFAAARSATSADKSLGMVYVQPQAIIDALGSLSSLSSGASAQSQVALNLLRQIVGKAGRAVAVGLQADSGSLRILGAQLGAPAPGAAGATGADSLAALPGDAWLALGFSDLGRSLSRGLGQLAQLSALGPGGAGIGQTLKRFEAKSHINIQRDLLSWMGDGALYARGHGLLDLGFALTIHSKNPARSQRAVGLIARALRTSGATVRGTTVSGYTKAVAVRVASLPVPFVIAAGGDRFSLGLNPQALTDVLHPSSTLGDSAQYAAASKALGSGLRPVFLLDTPTVIGLIQTLGAGASPSFAKVKPYLDALGPIAAGTEHDGDTARFALAIALR